MADIIPDRSPGRLKKIGFEGLSALYRISIVNKYMENNRTRAEAIRYLIDRSTINRRTGCWEWQYSCTNDGYGQIGPRWIVDLIGSKGAHRAAKIAFSDWHPQSRKEQARHQCHNRACINPDHLLVGTALENAQDSIRDGRRRTFSAEEITAIRSLHAAGTSQTALAREHQTSRTTISKIIKRKEP